MVHQTKRCNESLSPSMRVQKNLSVSGSLMALQRTANGDLRERSTQNKKTQRVQECSSPCFLPEASSQHRIRRECHFARKTMELLKELCQGGSRIISKYIH